VRNLDFESKRRKSLEEMLSEIEREIKVRQTIFPEWINSRRLTPDLAQHRYDCLVRLKEHLEKQIQKNKGDQQTLL